MLKRWQSWIDDTIEKKNHDVQFLVIIVVSFSSIKFNKHQLKINVSETTLHRVCNRVLEDKKMCLN